MLKKEKPNEVYDRIFKLTNGKDYGLFPAPMKAQVALNELCRYFLGEDWFSVNPISQEQINTEIVCEIESKYGRKKSVL